MSVKHIRKQLSKIETAIQKQNEEQKKIVGPPTYEQKIEFEKKLREATMKELRVKVDKAIIQKEILNKALFLLDQIDMDDIADVDFSTSDMGGSFQLSLNIEFKNVQE